MSGWTLEARIGLITLLVNLAVPAFALLARLAWRKWYLGHNSTVPSSWYF